MPFEQIRVSVFTAVKSSFYILQFLYITRNQQSECYFYQNILHPDTTLLLSLLSRSSLSNDPSSGTRLFLLKLLLRRSFSTVSIHCFELSSAIEEFERNLDFWAKMGSLCFIQWTAISRKKKKKTKKTNQSLISLCFMSPLRVVKN
jgi:hypothetical protein